ncbi:MAG: polyisoprenoid-binding protein YceI [Myxococcota bacterium]|jgi:polyisoprenoid-binding protein YceI
MNVKVLIPILLVTHAVAGGAGFFIAQKLLVKDDAWVKKNAADEQRQNDLDSALADEKPTTKPAPVKPETDAKPIADAKPAVTPEAKPPADFKPSIREFGIQGFGMSRVSFTSDAPLEEIVGTTTKVGGTFSVNLGDVGASKAGPITVEVGTLKTGIDMRDEHLQGEGWFNTAEHPNAIFALERIETKSKQLWHGHTISAKLHGKLTIRGIAKPVVTEATISYHPWTKKLSNFGIKEDILRIKSSFQVKLSDYEISAGVIGQKVAEVVEVSLSLTAIASAEDAEPKPADEKEAPANEKDPAADGKDAPVTDTKKAAPKPGKTK